MKDEKWTLCLIRHLLDWLCQGEGLPSRKILVTAVRKGSRATGPLNYGGGDVYYIKLPGLRMDFDIAEVAEVTAVSDASVYDYSVEGVTIWLK